MVTIENLEGTKFRTRNTLTDYKVAQVPESWKENVLIMWDGGASRKYSATKALDYFKTGDWIATNR